MKKKFASLCKYIAIFSNWPYAAFARYMGNRMPKQLDLHFRDGRQISFRPASDSVALGEIFVAEGYSACCRLDQGIQNIWDIGGNIGGFVVWASKLFPKAHFTSFEPCQATFRVLSATKRGNSRINWELCDTGLSSQDEICTAFVPNGHFGEASRYLKSGQEVEFRLRGIESVWEEAGRPVLDLVKIDCEGGEYSILEGCSDFLLSKINAIIMEIHPIPGHRSEEIKHRLESVGFQTEWFHGSQGVAFAHRTQVVHT